MPPTTVEFWRVGAEAGTTGAAAVKAHQERSVLLHGMKESLGIEVTNWGDTDAKHPSEIVEVIIALTPVVIPALAILIKLWLESRRLEKYGSYSSTVLGLKLVAARPSRLLLYCSLWRNEFHLPDQANPADLLRVRLDLIVRLLVMITH